MIEHISQPLNFGTVFLDTLDLICTHGEFKSSRLGRSVEVRNLSYVIADELEVSDYEDQFNWPVDLKMPNFEYAHAFSEWVLSGETKLADELLAINPFVKNYDATQADLSTFELPANFSMFYGPRVHAQIHSVAAELKANTDTRRAYISILDGMNDNKLLSGMREGKYPTVEYPCTIGFNYDVDQEGRLNQTVLMRSQNMVTVWPYDYLIGLKLLHLMAKLTGYKVGSFSGFVASAHVYEKDFEFCTNLLGLDPEWHVNA